jgi:hypothetical protein
MRDAMELFKQEAALIPGNIPSLNYAEKEDGLPYLFGELALRDEIGQIVDTYSIRIEPAPAYPFQFPYVYETGNRIPNNIDWHVFADGHCCIKSLPEELLLCKTGITLDWFIERQIVPYFFNQKYREIHGFFLHERSHGLKGNIEFFEDILRTRNPVKIVEWLEFIKKRDEPIRVSDCFCGSGIKYRKCHREAYRTLSKFTNQELEYYAGRVSLTIPSFFPRAT